MSAAEGVMQALSESAGVRVFCPGRVRTKGSLKPTHLKLGAGRCKVGLREDGEYSVPWKRAMMVAIRQQCAVAGYEGPVEVHSFFRFEREGTKPPGRFPDGCPECGGIGGHPASCSHSGLEACPTAREYGDEDKLRRNLLDALTQSGLLADDSQVVGGQNWKRFVRPDEQAGVEFVVFPVRPESGLTLAERYVLLSLSGGPV